jgi:hypothetical protein
MSGLEFKASGVEVSGMFVSTFGFLSIKLQTYDMQ